MLAGFTVPDEGTILIDGEVIHSLPPEKRGTGMVFQSYALFPHMTVTENIGFGLEMRKCPLEERKRRVATALDLVRLPGLGERYPRQLSGGQQQRVALARALVIEPSLLLLDEPLSNLDATLREEMRFEIREIQRRVGITTVFVTHDQTEAMAIADRLVIMNRGRLVQIGRPEEVYSAPADAFVACFIGQANLIPATVRGRDSRGTAVAIADGTTLSVAGAVGSTTTGDRVNIVVRPEDLAISKIAADGRNSLPAVVAKRLYLGASTRLVVETAGTTVTVTTVRPPEGMEPGAEIWLTWDVAHCALVPAAA
jgi:ABC-type Fe3+/spermidine/putrescine transport system ATPase subunit